MFFQTHLQISGIKILVYIPEKIVQPVTALAEILVMGNSVPYGMITLRGLFW